MSSTTSLEFLTKYFHHPDCPLGENGLRAYWEARDAFASFGALPEATEADRIALAIAENELEEKRKCTCGCPEA